MSGQSVLDREIFCDLARERGAATPATGGKDWATTYVLKELSYLFYLILWLLSINCLLPSLVL